MHTKNISYNWTNVCTVIVSKLDFLTIYASIMEKEAYGIDICTFYPHSINFGYCGYIFGSKEDIPDFMDKM